MIQMVKLAIPIETFNVENSIICSHFGRAPKFAIIDLMDNGSIKSISSVDNAGEHFGGHGTAMSVLSAHKPTCHSTSRPSTAISRSFLRLSSFG